jgi:uncharacterized membrane protein YhaH (DUF805 family)
MLSAGATEENDVVLVVHIAAGSLALTLGAIALIAERPFEDRSRAGTGCVWAVIAVAITAIALLGFIGQISTVGDTFKVFALTVLATLYVLGLFTFVRLVQSVNEDFRYGRAINRIRHHYLELAGDKADLFAMSAHDDAIGVLTNMGIKRSTRQAYFTTPTMVALINSVVGGSAVAIAAGALTDAPLGVSAGIGGLVAIASFAAARRFETRYLRARVGELKILFPSPQPRGR